MQRRWRMLVPAAAVAGVILGAAGAGCDGESTATAPTGGAGGSGAVATGGAGGSGAVATGGAGGSGAVATGGAGGSGAIATGGAGGSGAIATGGAGGSGATGAVGGGGAAGGGAEPGGAGGGGTGGAGATGGSGGGGGGGSVMVYLPAGPFVMGSDPQEGLADEQPEHVVTLSAYWIDRTEVTNAQYRQCVDAGVCSPPYAVSSMTVPSYYGNPAYDTFPVLRVAWQGAQQYCTWAGKRLPTEAEWEKAARGGCELVAPASCGPEDERRFAWGDGAASCALANAGVGYYCVGDTTAVGSYSPQGDSPYGVQDMMGNVYEWVADWYSATAYGGCASGCTDPTGPATGTNRILRGGGFGTDVPWLTVTSRYAVLPIAAGANRGFRCADSP